MVAKSAQMVIRDGGSNYFIKLGARSAQMFIFCLLQWDRQMEKSTTNGIVQKR